MTRNDDGVIAIIVALSISTFLLGFAALAVDLGSAYLRKAELQSIANQLATAGASGLPNIGTPEGALDRMQQSLIQLCKDSQTPGLCPADGSAPNLDWATDADPGNGQVTFLSDPNGDGQYSLADQVTDFAATNPNPATALEVTLPSSTVQFGLASAFGYKSAEIHKSAAARVGTPVGRGVLPFALTAADLKTGQFCVNVSGGVPQTVPANEGPIDFDFDPDNGNFPDGVPDQTPGLTDEIILQDPDTTNGAVPGQTHLDSVPTLHYLDDDEGSQPITVKLTLKPGTVTHWTFTLPPGDPGILASIWATGTYQGQPFVASGPNTPGSPGIAGEIIRYTGDNNYDGLCDQTSAYRGMISLARSPAVGDPLPQNIRTGPDVRLYKTGQGAGALGQVGSEVQCASQIFAAASTCVTTVTPGGPFTMDVEDGLLNSSGDQPGRLIGDCGSHPSNSGSHGVDGTNLFGANTGLLASGVDGHALQDRIVAAQPPTAGSSGLITSQALKCPRLAVLPVIADGPRLGVNGTVSDILDFRYVWIDDTTSVTNRGVNGTGSQITSFRGYIIPGGYFPSQVAGSPAVGPYLGGDMPKEALLIHDLNTPMT
jgi:Flp pilus assembly protein TadG